MRRPRWRAPRSAPSSTTRMRAWVRLCGSRKVWNGAQKPPGPLRDDCARPDWQNRGHWTHWTATTGTRAGANYTTDGFASVAMFLMYEACYNPTSFWAPYFRLLPLKFPGMNRWSVLSTSLLAGSLLYLAVDCCHRPSKLFHTIGNASGVHAVVAARAVRSAASPRRGVVGRPCHRQAPAAVWCRQPGPATAVGCRAAMGVDDRQHALLWRASWR